MNIIELAKQAGWTEEAGEPEFGCFNLKTFTNLVEAAARADEREACANIVDKLLKTWASLAGKDKAYQWLEKLSAAIRARGNT